MKKYKVAMEWLRTSVQLTCLIVVTFCIGYSIINLTDAAVEVLVKPEYSEYE